MSKRFLVGAALVAAGLVPAAAAAATTVPAASTATTTPPAPAAYPSVSGTWPTEWAGLADFTGTIQFAVPNTWREMELMPTINDDGSPRPWLAATPDMDGFLPVDGAADTFATPGVVFVAYPGQVDTAATVAASEYHQSCAAQPATTFARGLLAGHLQEFHSCGGTGTRIVYVAATITGAPHTYLVLVQLTGGADDATILDGILSSFSPITIPGS